jgi:hypothetical protein
LIGIGNHMDSNNEVLTRFNLFATTGIILFYPIA